MKRNVSSVVSLLLALTLVFSLNTNVVFASEYDVTESPAISDIEINLPDNVDMSIDNISVDKESIVKLNNDTIAQYIVDEIQVIDSRNSTEQDSVIYYGSDTGYLAQTNDYLLYAVNLTYGDLFTSKIKIAQ